MALPNIVKVVELGPRDGLQNEKTLLPAARKIELVERLAAAGLRVVEATAFVSPRWVPQMADSAEVLKGIRRRPGVSYPVLVPNLKGYERAVEAGAREVAIVAAASEAFSEKNLNASIDGTLRAYAEVCSRAASASIPVRAYVSCAVGCPYQGEVSASAAAEVARKLAELGCYELSMCDTIGVGTPDLTRRMIEATARWVPISKIAGHYHDTYGQALANVFASLELGVAVFDSSVAGLGGCPYAPGAMGNAATEDLVYLLNGLGITTGVDLDQVVDAGLAICAALGRESASRAGRAIAARRAGAA